MYLLQSFVEELTVAVCCNCSQVTKFVDVKISVGEDWSNFQNFDQCFVFV